MSKQRQRFSREFKLEAVRRGLNNGLFLRDGFFEQFF